MNWFICLLSLQILQHCYAMEALHQRQQRENNIILFNTHALLRYAPQKPFSVQRWARCCKRRAKVFETLEAHAASLKIDFTTHINTITLAQAKELDIQG